MSPRTKTVLLIGAQVLSALAIFVSFTFFLFLGLQVSTTIANIGMLATAACAALWVFWLVHCVREKKYGFKNHHNSQKS